MQLFSTNFEIRYHLYLDKESTKICCELVTRKHKCFKVLGKIEWLQSHINIFCCAKDSLIAIIFVDLTESKLQMNAHLYACTLDISSVIPKTLLNEKTNK